MQIRSNPPRIGWITGGLFAMLFVSVALGSYMVVASEWGASAHPARSTWFLGGIVTIAFAGGLTLLLLVWHAYAQREVTIIDDRVHVRRWLEVLTGKPGKRWSVRDVAWAEFLVRDAGAKLLIEARGERMVMSIWFWSMRDALALLEAFKRAGVATRWSIPGS